MNTIKIQNICGLESMSDTDLRQALQTLEANPIANVNWAEYPYAPEVSFKMACSDKAVAVLFEVKEDHVRAEAMENNGPVWQDSCVEFFIMDPDGQHYTNFEMNCAGTMLAARRTSRHDPVPFTSDKFTNIRRITSLPHEPIDSKGAEQSWWAIEVIPFEAFGYTEKPESLRANLYKCGDKCDQPHFLSWSPIGLPSPDFHCPAFFGTIEL
jgi:hypothetical protein